MFTQFKDPNSSLVLLLCACCVDPSRFCIIEIVCYLKFKILFSFHFIKFLKKVLKSEQSVLFIALNDACTAITEYHPQYVCLFSPQYKYLNIPKKKEKTNLSCFTHKFIPCSEIQRLWNWGKKQILRKILFFCSVIIRCSESYFHILVVGSYFRGLRCLVL